MRTVAAGVEFGGVTMMLQRLSEGLAKLLTTARDENPG